MNTMQAIDAISNGRLVKCERTEYETELRSAIQAQAAKWVDQGQHRRAIIALQEVRRLDAQFSNHD